MIRSRSAVTALLVLSLAGISFGLERPAGAQPARAPAPAPAPPPPPPQLPPPPPPALPPASATTAAPAAPAAPAPAAPVSDTPPVSTAPAPPQGAPPPRELVLHTSAQDAPTVGPRLELTTLRVLHDKGILSDDEYASALKDLDDSLGSRAEGATTLAVGRWATTIYGFVEADAIHDSTQGLNDLAGGAPIARAVNAPALGLSNYKGTHGQTMFSIRNSRLGFRLSAPSIGGVHPSGVIETDLLGVQPSTATEAQTFTSPTLRVRHAYVKVETPIVDILFGQTWALLGWQGTYFPNTAEIQGVPGELYARTPQVRLSKTVTGKDATFEIAIAALRPPSRDSEIPEGQAGLRFAVNQWTATTTTGATSTNVMPLSIAVTGDMRHYAVPNVPFNGAVGAAGVPTPNPLPNGSAQTNSAAIAVDAFIPVIPAKRERMGNSLALNGEFVTGTGFADMYTGLTGGITFPNIPLPPNSTQAVAYQQNIDNGLVTFDNVNFNLHPIQWTSYLAGAQYYFPGLDGRMWISGNYSHIQSANTTQFSNPAAAGNPSVSNYAGAATVRAQEDWFDVNLFGDVTSSVRVGAEFANFYDRYADGIHATNQRVQLSGWFIF